MLYLLPNNLGGNLEYSEEIQAVALNLKGIIAESEKGGRAFLSRFEREVAPHNTPLALLNKHTKEEDMDFLLEPLAKGEVWAFVSDAGLPCIADPGAMLVRRAKQRGIAVKGFSGPCSVTMALMLSGLSGQSFTFHGYLPKKAEERKARMKELEKRSRHEQSTQICIEAPHHNDKLLEELIQTLGDQTQLSVAWCLTQPGEGCVTQSVQTWKKYPSPKLHKKPAIFLFSA